MAKKENMFKRAIRSLFVAPASDLSLLVSPNNLDFGVNVTTDAALRFTAVFAAIKILSENIAALPKSVKVITDRGAVPAKDHPVYRLLHTSPNNYTDIFTFWFSIVSNILGYGNAFAVIERDLDGNPVALHQVPPMNVTVAFVNGKKAFVVRNMPPNKDWLNKTYLNWEMLHFMYFSIDGIYGIDPITYNASAIGRGIAAQKFSSEFYRKGGQIKGVLETEGNMGDGKYEQWIKRYQEAAQNFETPLLEYGIKYKSIGISPVAAQLINSETLSIQDIARIFSVPPHLLAELSHATFSNIEQQNIFFSVYSLRPLCKRIEQQIENKLLSGDGMEEYSVKIDLRGMMRGDDAARSTYYEKAINAGWMTPNEARELEEMPMLPGLDKPRRPLNTVDVGDDESNEN